MILSFGGIPLLYYGDAIGMLNSLEYLADPSKRDDNRWMHRSHFDWDKAEKASSDRHGGAPDIQRAEKNHRAAQGNAGIRGLRQPPVADGGQPQPAGLFPQPTRKTSATGCWWSATSTSRTQTLSVDALRMHGFFQKDGMKDLLSGTRMELDNDAIVLPPLSWYWLTD